MIRVSRPRTSKRRKVSTSLSLKPCLIIFYNIELKPIPTKFSRLDQVIFYVILTFAPALLLPYPPSSENADSAAYATILISAQIPPPRGRSWLHRRPRYPREACLGCIVDPDQIPPQSSSWLHRLGPDNPASGPLNSSSLYSRSRFTCIFRKLSRS